MTTKIMTYEEIQADMMNGAAHVEVPPMDLDKVRAHRQAKYPGMDPSKMTMDEKIAFMRRRMADWRIEQGLDPSHYMPTNLDKTQNH